ncbi:MAG: helix-turn-helix domain-containing protein [Candidatus Bathyarchaeia archaeon]|nr:transcriptional regulator [Candidatus Bathyarchaeota archaeon]
MSENGQTALVKLLEELNENIKSIGAKLDRIVTLQEGLREALAPREKTTFEGLPLDVATLLSLPDHLRKTALALAELGEATATEISKKTGRVRAAESDYLNQLVAKGYVKKKRRGHGVYFYIEAH